MRPRWLCGATLAPLVVALASAAFGTDCDAESDSLGLSVQCAHLRLLYETGQSLEVRCDPQAARADDYGALYALNLTVGDAPYVVLHLCPLPVGSLQAFLQRLGVTGVQSLNIRSHAVLSDTMPADYLAGLDIGDLRLENLMAIQLFDDFLQSSPRLENFTITGTILRSGPPSGLFRGLDQLQMLALERLGLREIPDELFSGLAQLRNLSLSHNDLDAIADGTFTGLRSLQNLDLSGNRLRSMPPDLLSDLGQLDTLYLNDNALSTLPSDVSMFRNTPRLGRLFLQDNQLTSVTRDMVMGLRESLWLLRLSDNNLTLANSKTAFQELTDLRELDLRHNNITGISEAVHFLPSLKKLDLRYNNLSKLDRSDVANFISRDADIYLQHNNITCIIPRQVEDVDNRRPANRIHVGDNPISCNCRQVSLKQYLDRSGPFVQREVMDRQFLILGEDLVCASPSSMVGKRLAAISAEDLVCPLPDGCPTDCQCQLQTSSRTVIVSCRRLPLTPWPALPAAVSDFAVRLKVEGAGLLRLNSMKNITSAKLTSLHVSRNDIGVLTPAQLPSGLEDLHLSHNNLSSIPQNVIDFLELPENNQTRLWLGHNPYVCDCKLLPLLQFLQLQLSAGDQRRVEDADDITCIINNRNTTVQEMRPDDLCPSHTAAIVAGSVLALVVMASLLVAALVYYRYGDWFRVWLYAHGLCLWLVTEEEMDSDKKYDAFISYSHLDEAFVVEQLVPQLEQGEPRYSLCLHFRDWLAGEWITDQIQRSVEDSRRVIVVMSQNFIASEWGRLEFLAAHKQALNDKTNRLIVIVYGELPPTEAMDPELRLYISSNTYLKWGDERFWQRLRYALPHRGRRLKRRQQRRRQVSEKLGLVSRENGRSPVPSSGVTPVTETAELPATPTANGHQDITRRQESHVV